MRGKKYNDDIKEQAYALYAIYNNYNEVSRELNVPITTIKNWIDKKSPDELDELRNKNKEDFVKRAGELIDKLIDRIDDTISNTEKDIPLNHLTTALGTIYDKRALADGGSTENVSVEIKLPEGFETYAG